MSKRLLCLILLTCSFNVAAADWQRDFFSSLTNELPPARGVAIDDLGNVHAQTFNRFSGQGDYFLAHHYTLGAQGQVLWGWGLSQVDRMSDCGVYAKSGQRLDCTRSAGWLGDETRLEMRGRYDASPIWRISLPDEVRLLDASIPNENEALFVSRLNSPAGIELGVFRANGFGPADVLSVVPACPMSGQTPSMSQFRMPQDVDTPIRHLKACPTAYGTTDLIVENFDPWSGQWTVLATWSLPFGADVTDARMTADGKAFALVDRAPGFRELLASGVYGDAWIPMPVPAENRIAGFVANEHALSIAFEGVAQDRVDVENVLWFDLQGGFWPQFTPTPALSGFDAKAFALSDEGALIVTGNDPAQPLLPDQVWLTNRYGQHHTVATLPLTPDEITVGTPYLLAGPGNVAVIARAIARDEGGGETTFGVRLNQYDLPMSP